MRDALAGARILNVNATSYGGGVSELLRSSVPLLRDLGLTVDWKVIGGDEDFFHATKALHNALQGAPRRLSDAEQAAYMQCIQENAATLDGGYDFIVIHDPQPAGLLQAHGKGSARWVWRCHIDTSEPNPDAWSFMEPLLAGFDAAVFTMPEFVPPDFPVRAGGGDRAGDRSLEPQEHRPRSGHGRPDPRLDRRRGSGTARDAGIAL